VQAGPRGVDSDASSGAKTAAQQSEVPLPYWSLVKRLFNILGAGSTPLFVFWQVMLWGGCLASAVAKSSEVRFAHAASEPQPPFMPWMSTLQRLALAGNDLMNCFLHWRFVRLAGDPDRFQVFEALCDVTVRIGASMLNRLCRFFVVTHVMFQLLFFAVTPGQFSKAANAYVDEPDLSQFPSNVTTVVPKLLCSAHILDSYDNHSAAIEACDDLNNGIFRKHTCAGIGIRGCSEDGPFDLCDSRWPPVATVDFTDCVSVHGSENDLAWLRDKTDPLNYRRNKVGMALYSVFMCSGCFQLIDLSFLLFFVVVNWAAIERMKRSVATLKQIPRDDPTASSTAMGQLVYIQKDVLEVITGEFRHILIVYFASRVLMLLYNVLDLTLGKHGYEI